MTDDDFTLLSMVVDALENVQVSTGAWGYPKAEEARAALGRIRERLNEVERLAHKRRLETMEAQDLAAGNMNVAIANAETAAELQARLDAICSLACLDRAALAPTEDQLP